MGDIPSSTRRCWLLILASFACNADALPPRNGPLQERKDEKALPHMYDMMHAGPKTAIKMDPNFGI